MVCEGSRQGPTDYCNLLLGEVTVIDAGRVRSWPDKERGMCVSGWEVVRYGGLKGGEEGELNSEQKSSIHKKKFST